MRGALGARRTRLVASRRRLLAIVATALGALASLAVAPPALAGLQQEFAVFDQCPLSVSSVTTCVYSKVTSGEFTLGSKTVPIDKEVILQGGISSGSATLVPAANGETLSRTPLTVPGGLLGIEGLGGEVTATAELAGAVELDATNLLAGYGTAVSLPLKVKLDNPLLGRACHIGSASEPIAVPLTTGTTNPPQPNQPITGNPGHFVYTAAGKIVTVPSSTLVENAFSVPAANGCDGLLALLVDPLVDLAAGVPAAAGHNTAIMTGSLETATVAAVKAQALLPEIGQCELAETTGEGGATVYHGGYSDSACTSEDVGKLGMYEWVSGAGSKNRFTATGKLRLEGAAGAEVKCKTATAAGEYVGAKSLTAVLTLTGCERVAGEGACESAGAAPGEIVTSPLDGSVGFIADEVDESEVVASLGIDLGHEPSLFTATCAGSGEPLVVEGSFIAPVTKVDKMASSFSLKASASAGRQEPEAFEGGPDDTLSATMGAGAEAAGVHAKLKIANEEELELKAVAR